MKHCLNNYLRIIAPENANSGAADWTLFEEVWQYGSNLDQPNADPLYLQDGVAPQMECQGLINANGKQNTNGTVLKTGRAFIPNGSPKGFVESHKIKNYGWIFNRNSIHRSAGFVILRK